MIKGRPKASVLCAAQNVAAIASPSENPKRFNLKKAKSEVNDAAWIAGSNVRSATACLTSKPNPLVNALQKAFQTIPSRTIWCEHVIRRCP